MNHRNNHEKELNKLKKDLHGSLLELEQNIKVTPPSLCELEQLVETVQTEQKKKLYQELIIFWAIAIFVITLVLWSYVNFFFITFVGQLAIISCLFGYFLYRLKKHYR
ncbi:YxlC family protein [Alkalihalobacterium elongatum]|uniref:YxlC family protein n=1 Tax=Alkalihalobacterium elongatum TaxID=2675466 RepID=UPI001C1F3D7C|nr:YxlC family protein [Alkalihalobacterium elongatum]